MCINRVAVVAKMQADSLKAAFLSPSSQFSKKITFSTVIWQNLHNTPGAPISESGGDMVHILGKPQK